MRKNGLAPLLCAGLLFTGLAVHAQHQHVTPGEFTFGSCGRVQGGRVPTTLSPNQSYYSRFSCESAYTTVDVCLQHAESIRDALHQYGTLGKCETWLKGELGRCRDFIQKAVSECATLDE